ncbi:hypothetical protein GQ55_6G138600 [Panicum hallii var. hallii]|uniref:Uncharacterized protein n=1 Tax=Panicum hallii var. hallii TaxID=1504633 RepID=A0A2T7D630_9POAL|nr:hypothetical protein GQ55_6G138600 [Panicum hallii var. hallii]
MRSSPPVVERPPAMVFDMDNKLKVEDVPSGFEAVPPPARTNGMEREQGLPHHQHRQSSMCRPPWSLMWTSSSKSKMCHPALKQSSPSLGTKGMEREQGRRLISIAQQ